MQKEKVLLAFSGGLDTSYCVKYFIHEKDLEVHTAVVNTGGFSKETLDEIAERAYALGATHHIALEGTQAFYEHIVKYLIFGNVLKNNTYPLSVSAERVYQAIALAQYAQSIGAKYIGHGSTGAGNDQIRFDMIFHLVAPELEILTPVRDQILTRQDEIAYLSEHGVSVEWTQAKYSINKGLWGTSIGGEETLTSHKPLPESAFPSPLKNTNPQTIKIGFEKGEINSLNGKKTAPVEAIQQIESLASQYAIGRDMHTGDTIIGIKGRIGFEAAAAVVIIKAHHVLEKHTLTKWQLYWKEQLANWYGMFLHESQYFEPVMRNIETFLQDSQQNVSGEVTVQLHPYRFEVEGISSEHDLMKSDFGEYGEVNKAWTGEDIKGFTKIFSNAMQIYQNVNSSK